MEKTQSIQEQHTAGAQAIGFDYQFYCFMLLALELRHGQKVGFEVKDDVHIDKADGTTTLLQTKHSVLKSSNGAIQNLTTFRDLTRSTPPNPLKNVSRFVRVRLKKRGDSNITSFFILS